MSVINIQFTPLELRIVKYLFKHYNEKYNARQLARALDVNHAHVNILCGQLVTKKLLKKEDLGNSIYFTFNYEERLAVSFMDYILSLELQEFPEWLTVVVHSLNKFEKYVTFGVVFGSSINNNQFNDIDVLLVYDKRVSKDIKKIKEEIRRARLVEKPIRYVDVMEKDVPKNKDDTIFYSLLANNLIFTGAEKYVGVIRICHK